ncbi:MAG: molybdopterin molybdotransferase MoeA [Erythrobacter sp.]|nr:molybdopterin molybdotransferase MoeA [Erythrobacter sp.]
MSRMLGLEEAQERLLALAPKRPTSRMSLGSSAPHRYLAEDVVAKRTQPPADLSAMDGYAIAPGEGPWHLVGESRAGSPFAAQLGPGQCVRISTGAHIPSGADRVLIQENAQVSGASIAASELPPAGRHIRRAGFDFACGDMVLTKGTLVTPAVVALAISSGQQSLPIVEPPSVAVLDSGDELVAPGQPCGLHQIPASNGPMIGAMLHPYVGRVGALGPVPDDLESLAAALEKAKGSDILITSGGASVGDHDLVQKALTECGAKIDFWKVAIKPGKPLLVATRESELGRQVILGLPGNPVSSFVTCFLFGLPLVRAAMGDPNPLPQSQMLEVTHDLPEVGRRREFLRAVSDGRKVRLAASQDSSALEALASANSLIDRPTGAPSVRAGKKVAVYNLQNG